MPFSFIIAHSFIIVPDPQLTILSSGDEMFAFSGDIDGIEFFLGALDGSDNLPIIFLPVGDFVIGSGCQYLVLLWVDDGLLEDC